MTKITNKLFNPAMAQALWEGRKTETRRLFKDTPEGAVNFTRDDDGMWDCMLENGEIFPCHFGRRTRLGDLIWVKEAHYAYGYWRKTGEKTATGKDKRKFVRDAGIGASVSQTRARKSVRFRPDNIDVLPNNLNQRPSWYKRPSLFMERADSRMTLRVTGFNIERLHDITEAGAIAEGCVMDPKPDDNGNFTLPAEIPHKSGIGLVGWDCARDWYADLWDDINGPDAWDANHWVSVTKFEVIKQNVLEIAN